MCPHQLLPLQTDVGNLWVSPIAQLVKNPTAMQETLIQFLSWEVPLAKGSATHSSILGLPFWLRCKESTCNAGDLGSITGLGRSPGGGHGNPVQYSCLENPHGWRSFVGCSPWGHKESDATELLNTAQHIPVTSQATCLSFASVFSFIKQR